MYAKNIVTKGCKYIVVSLHTKFTDFFLVLEKLICKIKNIFN